jgi:putative heme iron utilization protein
MSGHITSNGQPLRVMQSEEPFSAVDSARRVLRLSPTGSLATLREDGTPFASLVTVATTQAGEPLVLLSDIAVHTKNLKRDPRVSLLLIAPGGEGGDPLAGARLSIIGTIAEDTEPAHRRRFLARHQEARGYSTFRDFHFYRISVIGSHLVAGFGRIVDLSPAELLTDVSDSAELAEAEESAVEHMNEDHAEALSLYATRLLGMPAGTWVTTGADPDGLDLRAGQLRARLPFPQKARNGGDLRAILVHFAKEARGLAAS